MPPVAVVYAIYRKMKTRIWGRLCLAAGVCLLLLPSPARGAEPGIAPETDMARIFHRPQVRYSSVTWETAEEQSRWITMDVDVHVFTDRPFETLRAATLELENYPRIFKRLTGARVIRSAGGLFFEMFVSVGLAGITYDTNYTMRVTEAVNSPAQFKLDYTWHAGDGLVRDDTRGVWYLEAASADGVPGTYIRYTVHGVVLKKYPLQGEIMRMFMNMEHEELMREFLRSARSAGAR